MYCWFNSSGTKEEGNRFNRKDPNKGPYKILLPKKERICTISAENGILVVNINSKQPAHATVLPPKKSENVIIHVWRNLCKTCTVKSLPSIVSRFTFVSIHQRMKMTSHNTIIMMPILLIAIVILGTPTYCFTDSLGTQNVDHMITAFKSPQVLDNTTLAVQSKKGERQTLLHAGLPASLANLGGFGTMASIGSLRTVMMGGMLYGLSLIPAVVLALGGNGLPFGGMLSALGMKKRALPETSSAKMPLLSEPQTKRLLQMLQSAFRQWNVADEHCKQLFVCQMYRQVSSNGVTPDLELFKEALLHILERGGQRRAGRAAEHLLAEYEHYFAAARMGMKQDNCESHYSRCGLSLYPANDGFKSERSTAVAKKTAAKDSPSKKTSE
ncbi:uncharacterized protein CDAR_255031 [Caerostris darwini]|uniref:Uncharacterized protein n=1 Tax=Caerostris darwini TaxID=1538125 RepID=A0AAV4VAP2_9ARAC|nr:uncharacterized protein CDAR_255031 [Caerostris darwini]